MDRRPRALRILDVMETDRHGDDFFEVYTKDLTGEDVQRLFTRDARDAYRFFTRHIDEGRSPGCRRCSDSPCAHVSFSSPSR